MRYHTQPEDAGLAAGVFTYFIPEMAFTLAVMYTVEFSLFDNLAQSYWYNVKIYSDRKHANKDLFYDISHDSVQADGKIHHMELGFDFTAEVEASGTFSHTPTLTVRNMNINKLLRKNLNTE